jgi:DNA-binding PadR family transcriptional regulator
LTKLTWVATLYDNVIYVSVRELVMHWTDKESPLPLPPHMFLVLLVLNAEAAHGYGIKKAVRQRSGGMVDLDAGGLYRLIARLEERGWARPAPALTEDGGDARRKYYALTDSGRDVLSAEARRISALAQAPDVMALAISEPLG